MDRPGQRGTSQSFRRSTKRFTFLLETLETRRVLSTASATTVILPNVGTVTADRGSPWGGWGWGGGGLTKPTPTAGAYTPAQIATAYGISKSSTSGSGVTIAIVDAYNDPNIAADLAAFDAQYGLPAASLTVMNQYGQATNLPRTDAGWSLEIAMDVEWAHAAAPGAKIVLVEASSESTSDLMTAVQTAARFASVVSMSWGGSEWQGETAYDTAAYFANPKVTFVAATGDDGAAAGAEWPSVSPYVVGVGGTTLSLTGSGTISSETAWNYSGSAYSGASGSTGGKSLYESAPTYQLATYTSTTKRSTPDVAAVANPNTGLSVYDTVAGTGQTGWFEVGGTSAGSPLWAGIIAAADQARAATGKAALSSAQTLNLLYGLYKTSAYTTDFHDVTVGSNLAARAATGYDMVTGLGSPVASKLVAAASTYTTTAAAVKVAAVTTTTRTTTTAKAHDVTSVTTAAETPAISTTLQTPLTLAVVPDAPAPSLSPSEPSVTPSATTTARALPAQAVRSQSVRPVFIVGPSEVAPALNSGSSEAPQILTRSARQTTAPQADRSSSLVGEPSGLSFWDRAVEGYYEGETPIDPSSWTVEDTEEVEEGKSGPSALLLTGTAMAAWAAWEDQSRRSGKDRRRGAPFAARPVAFERIWA